MSTIRQTCPSCQRTLELPAAAVGRQAKCPACQTQFAVPGVPSDDVAATPASASAPAENPFSTPIGGNLNDPAPAAGYASTNPYQPSATTPAPTVQIGDLTIYQRSVEDIWGAGFAIFKANMGLLVGCYVAVFFVNLVAAFMPQVFTAAAGALGNEALSVAAAVGSQLFFNLLNLYLTLGFCKLCLNVARGQQAGFGDLFVSVVVLVKFVAGMMVLGIVGGLVAGVIALIFAGIIAAGLQDAAAIVGLAFAVLVGIPLIFIVYCALWSWAYILVDGRGGPISSLRYSYTIAANNKVTSLLLIFIVLVASFAGLLACYFGLVFTTPLWIMVLAVGYLMITGQPIEDPRLRQMNPQFQPPPTSPQF